MIIWITGLSGSGKTTLAKNLIHRLSKKIKKKTIILMVIILEIYLMT